MSAAQDIARALTEAKSERVPRRAIMSGRTIASGKFGVLIVFADHSFLRLYDRAKGGWRFECLSGPSNTG